MYERPTLRRMTSGFLFLATQPWHHFTARRQCDACANATPARAARTLFISFYLETFIAALSRLGCMERVRADGEDYGGWKARRTREREGKWNWAQGMRDRGKRLKVTMHRSLQKRATEIRHYSETLIRQLINVYLVLYLLSYLPVFRLVTCFVTIFV